MKRMNNKFFSLLIAMFMSVACVSLTSCGSNDDNEIKKPTATTANAQPVLCIFSEMFDYFDVTCTIDGETVKITKDNTYDETITKAEYGKTYQVRKYKVDKKQFTKFPATMTVTAQCKVKDGVDLRKVEKLSYLLYLDMVVGNNNNDTFSTYKPAKYVFQPYPNANFSKLTEETFKKFENATKTITASFESADCVVVQ